MKSKIIIISFLIVSLFVITSCSGDDGPVQTNNAFIGGTQGVVGYFEEFGVPEDGIFTIFDTESFPLRVKLINKGEYELQPTDVTVELLGPAQSELGTSVPSFELPNVEIIDDISELVPEGGEETISFSDDAMFITPITGFADRQWFANIEYKYQTYVIIPEVCLKEDLTDNRVCQVKEPKTFFVSGAPVIVTSVEESTAGRGIMALKIRVSNVAGGRVTKIGEDFDATRETFSFSIDAPNAAEWECKSGGKVNEGRLVNGQAEIICKLVTPLAEDFIGTKQVSLTLDYLYRDLIQETLRIKESSN